MDPLIKSHLKLVSLQWPFRQSAVHVALDIVGRLTPVGMSIVLAQRTPFERTGTTATFSRAVMSAVPSPKEPADAFQALKPPVRRRTPQPEFIAKPRPRQANAPPHLRLGSLSLQQEPVMPAPFMIIGIDHIVLRAIDPQSSSGSTSMHWA